VSYRPRELIADLLESIGVLLFLASANVHAIAVLVLLLSLAWGIYYLCTSGVLM